MSTNGSLQNLIATNSKNEVAPTVGIGATEIMWSDRHAYTVVEIISDREIVVQRDIATRTDKNWMSDAQSYTFSPNPTATRVTLVFKKSSKRSRWVRKGESINSTRFLIGTRDEHYDYTI